MSFGESFLKRMIGVTHPCLETSEGDGLSSEGAIQQASRADHELACL
jgi:hypothetical protein